MYGKSNMEIYITICKIDSQRAFAVAQETQTGASYQPRGWNGEGDAGREFQNGWDICIPMADSC